MEKNILSNIIITILIGFPLIVFALTIVASYKPILFLGSAGYNLLGLFIISIPLFIVGIVMLIIKLIRRRKSK